MTEYNTISLAKVSPFPAGRTREDGPYSGEQFREDVLLPALKTGPVLVMLDHDAGFRCHFSKKASADLYGRVSASISSGSCYTCKRPSPRSNAISR